MRVGDKVRYVNDESCIGIIVEVGSNLYRVKWNNSSPEEWMPEYALKVINESR